MPTKTKKPRRLSDDELRALERHPGVTPHRPPAFGWCDKSCIVQSEDLLTVQWYGRLRDGRFHPWGKPLPIPAT